MSRQSCQCNKTMVSGIMGSFKRVCDINLQMCVHIKGPVCQYGGVFWTYNMQMCVHMWAVIQFLNTERRKRNEFHERLCNAYSKAISRSNVYEWIKKFNKGHMELHNQAPLRRPSNSYSKETCRIRCCLFNNDHHLTIYDLHHEIAAQYTSVIVSRMSIYQILTNESKW